MVDYNLSFTTRLKLNTQKEYKKVFAKPLKSIDPFFTILFVKNGLDHPRLGMAIAKKQVKRAVDRNKIKRSARESFRLKQLTIGNFDIVVLARREAATASKEKLFRSLNDHWLKLAQRCG